MYGGYRITFDSAGSWSFDNARKVVIFGVDNSSSSHADDCKNNFLMLGESSTFGINGNFGSPEKKFSTNFSKANTNFAWVCFIMLVIVTCLLIEKKPLSLKSTMKVSTFQLSFILEVYVMDLVLLSLEKYL